MRPSAQIRHLATKYASTNPEVAFDLLDLAGKVAQSEQEEQQQTQQKQGGELPPALKKHMEEKAEGKKDEGKDEGQDQGQKQAYAQLKAACIQAATNNPAARSAFLPVLKVIKNHG